jgi:acetoin utilization deacetylase AcuC-like enzyme
MCVDIGAHHGDGAVGILSGPESGGFFHQDGERFGTGRVTEMGKEGLGYSVNIPMHRYR